MNRAIFLDRDGTLNPDPGYIAEPDDFSLFPGVVESLKKLSNAGFILILITNQSGIARGLIKPSQLEAIHEKLKNMLELGGVSLSAIYHCPHHPDFPSVEGVADCDCRKPLPGMILRAIEAFNIDPDQSYMIGDRVSDIKMALNAGVSPIFIGKQLPGGFEHLPGFPTLNDASEWILAADKRCQ